MATTKALELLASWPSWRGLPPLSLMKRCLGPNCGTRGISGSLLLLWLMKDIELSLSRFSASSEGFLASEAAATAPRAVALIAVSVTSA